MLVQKARQEENRRLCGNCYCTDYEGYIFLNDIGELIKPDYVSTHFRLMVKKNQFRKLRFHDLRHTYGTRMAELNTPTHLLQNQMGHSYIHITQQYYIAMSKAGVDILQGKLNQLYAGSYASGGLLSYMARILSR